MFDFIGHSNQIEGEVRDGQFHAYGLVTPVADDGCASGPAVLYLRPHDLTPSESKRGLLATVIDVKRLAGRVTLETSVSGQPRAVVIDLSSHDLLRLPERGESLQLQLRNQRVFPANR